MPEAFRDRPAEVVAPLLTRIALHVLDTQPAAQPAVQPAVQPSTV